MRILNGVLACLLILFAVVQYNDPDGLYWGAIYGGAAIWCGLAALKPAIFRMLPVYLLYGACVAAALVGVFWYWPTTPNWWLRDVWWETETAREGMGMMIVVLFLLFAGLVARKVRQT